jgi:hypothetical protein
VSAVIVNSVLIVAKRWLGSHGERGTAHNLQGSGKSLYPPT